MKEFIQKQLQNIRALIARLVKRAPQQEVQQEPQQEAGTRRKKAKLSIWNILPKVLMVVFVATFCFSAFQIFRNSKQAGNRDQLYNGLANIAVKPADPKPNNNQSSGSNATDSTGSAEIELAPGLTIAEYSPISVDFELLQEQNSDVMAWVYCPGTPISYPVVRGTDNDYYLSRLLDGTENRAGSIFADCRNRVDFSDPHTLIYGHNMKDLSMFGSVYKYGSQSYYEQHPVWYINTPEKNYAVVLLAGHVTSPSAEIYAFKGTPEEPMEILQNALRSSAFKSMATYQEGEHLVTFSTCHGSSRRFILVGALREIG